MPSKLELVPAAAGKRLGAAVLDWLPPVTVLTILLAVGFAGITRTPKRRLHRLRHLVPGAVRRHRCRPHAGLPAVLATLEGRSGATLGNRLMGIRSTDDDGYAPGGGAVFLRGLITGAGVLLAVLAAAAAW